MTKREELERQALKIIMRRGEEGIPQCELWRELKASSREGSRVSLSLERKKKIRRDRVLYNGRWTYRVSINIRPIEVDSILDVPCVSCPELFKCETGGSINPNVCKRLTEWLLTLYSKEKDKDGDINSYPKNT